MWKIERKMIFSDVSFISHKVKIVVHLPFHQLHYQSISKDKDVE